MSLVQTTDITIKLLANGTARDKLNRFVQYFTKFLVWYGQKNGFEKDTLARMSNLVAALACTRKTMRLGKQLDHARNISKSGSITDDILRVLTISKSFGLGLWLVHDALGWANTQKIIKLEAPKDVSRRGNQFWLFALVSSLMINVYKLRWNAIRLSQEQRILKANGTQAKDLSAADKIKALQVEKSNLVYATVSDSLDICIPSISLEYLPLEPGVAGLCGAITSLMAVWTQLKPLLK